MNATIQWFPLLPVPVVLSVAAALIALLTYGSWLLREKSVPRQWVTLLAVVRAGMIAVFVLALLRPVVSMPRTVEIAPEALVLVDTSASMTQPSGQDGTRWDNVRDRLSRSPAIAAAEKSHRLHWFTFDSRAHSTSSTEWRDAQPAGESTDLAASLESAYQQVQLSGGESGRRRLPTRALIVSDGLDAGSKDVTATATKLGLTVDVLAPTGDAAASSGASARVVDVQGSQRVLLGSETALLATVHSEVAVDGLALVLDEEGREVARQELGPLVASSESRVVLTHKPAEPGLKRYSARLVRQGESVGQPRGVNVLVTDRKHDVLLLEDTWRWDFKYLKRVFEDDPSFSFTALASRGGGVYVQFGEPERRVQPGGFPRSRAELDGFETIVLGNVNPQTWPRGLAKHLQAAVLEGGKSLVVIAGPHLGKWADVPELSQLLPVEVNAESGVPVTGRVELRLTPEGTATGWFSPSRENAVAPMASAASPSVLPPMENLYPAIRKRPAATVLVEAAASENEYGALPVIAEHLAGRGRVLFIATDTLWRWQTLGPRDEAGTTLYATFWQQALRAMAPAEPTALPIRLWVRPERTVYRTGDAVRLTTELELRQDAPRGQGSKPAPAMNVSAQVVFPDGRRLPLDLSADRGAPSRSAARFDVTQPGQYRIEAASRTESQSLAEVATVIDVLPRPGERDPAPVDAAALARLASATGGRTINPDTADGWLPAESAPRATVTERRTFDLWHNFAMLLCLCVFLATDWSVRLFRGYV